MGAEAMAGQPGFFDVEERYAALSAAGDSLEQLAAVVDFEIFRPVAGCGAVAAGPHRSQAHHGFLGLFRAGCLRRSLAAAERNQGMAPDEMLPVIGARLPASRQRWHQATCL